MKKVKKQLSNIFSLIKEIDQILKNKPSYEEMLINVKMMNIKVKPIKGSLIDIDLNNKKIIELLWSLNKIENFLNNKGLFLNLSEKKLLIDYFDKFIEQYQQEILKIRHQKDSFNKKNNVLEIEIFREIKDKIN